MHSVLHAFTHSVVWASILASALVALIVTLLVEYLAKPGLEARKDRILEKRREQRTALRDIKRCSVLARELYVWGRVRAEGEGGDEITVALKEQARRMAAEIDELGKSAYGAIKMPTSVDEEWEKVMGIIIGYLIAFCAQGRLPRAFWEQYDRAAIRLSYFVEFLTTSNWHPLRKRGMLTTIKSSPLPSYKMREASKENNSLPDLERLCCA